MKEILILVVLTLFTFISTVEAGAKERPHKPRPEISTLDPNPVPTR